MDNENTSLVKLTWFDRIFKPQIITLPNGHSTMRRRSRVPLILLLLLVAIYLSLRMTGFDLKLIINRFDKLLDLFVKLFHPKWEFFNKVIGPLVDNEGIIRCEAGEAISDDALLESIDWLISGVSVLE